jgi:adenine deaminase
LKQAGIAVCSDDLVDILPLPIAGIINDKSIDEVAANYDKINTKAKEIGSPLTSPFMTLSFMALIVIPQLKICDKGLFDVNKFGYIDLFV